ncbi:uncharacterized protein LOC134290505 [Aedes albopictus]|uniref:CCHC-type domain-containing protein n=1 Tax=Aedes albopictus TaxID=7160 RepID=A0ABM1ZQA4_AEDAL
MDLTHLSNEEIDYELAIRFVVNLGPSTHRNKVLKLKELMAQEGGIQDRVYESSEHVMCSSSNIETCQVRIGKLKTLVDEAIQIKDPFAISQLRSRLIHYDHRLASIKPLAPFVSTKQTLCSLVKVLMDDVDNALAQIGKRGDKSDSAVTNLNPHGEARESEGNRKQNGMTQENTDGAYAHIQQQQQVANPISPGTRDTEAITRQRGGQSDLVNNTSRRSTEGVSPLASRAELDNSNHDLHDNSSRQEYDPQLSATSSPVSGRGRGVTLRRSQDLRPNTNGRGRADFVPILHDNLSVGSNNNNNNNDEITFRNIVVNNASLYADLLERLARRERPTRSPPTERAEDRRMMKAVHNWPFKFRGEKDTTSLNIFLDRVETFAKSEGMSDGTLLSSIKHLLQDDALDWYARAMSQRLLFSWQAFKQEIKREFLPSGYAQILRLEASFRFQGQSESFAKYYRDIAALFRFISPPMTEDEKFFIVKKNMNADYAAIVTAARPVDLREMVEVCTSYDETRMLLNRQRRIPVPHNALLEPSFATPTSSTKPFQQAQPQRYPRVNTVEMTDRNEDGLINTQQHTGVAEGVSTHVEEEAEWQDKMEQLLQQVYTLKGQLDRKQTKLGSSSQGQSRITSPQHSSTIRPIPQPQAVQHQQRWQPGQRQEACQQERVRSYTTHVYQPAQSSGELAHNRQYQPGWQAEQQPSGWQQERSISHQNPQVTVQNSSQQSVGYGGRPIMTCWNCDEEGHRFMDCPKPQAILFCYRCGRKGYSLRSCFTCRTDAGNQQAGNRQ